jgi:hypothetical protein
MICADLALRVISLKVITNKTPQNNSKNKDQSHINKKPNADYLKETFSGTRKN